MHCLLLFVFFVIAPQSPGETTDQLSELQKHIIKSIVDSRAAGNDSLAADFLRGKFLLQADGRPVFYPTPYPIVPSRALPRIGLNKAISGATPQQAPQRATLKRRTDSNVSESSQSCSVFLNPPALFPAFSGFPQENSALDCLGVGSRQNLQIDESGLASLQINTPEGMPQSAYISVPDLNLLSVSEQARLFSTGAAPTVPLKPVPVTFLEYVYYTPQDSEYAHLAQAVKGIKVQVGGTLVPLLPLAPPPAPSCELALLTAGPVREGNTIEFGIKVNSVTRSASFSAPGLNEDLSVPESALAQSTVGPLTQIGTLRVQIPNLDDATPSEDGTHVIWPAELDVRGVDSSLDPQICGANVRVEKIPRPLCALTADRTSIALNQTANLTLDCNQPGSGPVTSATINNTNVTLNRKVAKLAYKRTTKGLIEIAARAVGPGGEHTSTLVFQLGPGCPSDDPNYLWMVRAKGDLGKMGEWFFGRAPRKVGKNGYTLEKASVKGWGKCPADSYCMDYHTGTQGNRRWSFLQVGPRYSPTCFVQRAMLRNIGCFAKDTQIQMASGLNKPVSEIIEGDWVFNPHYQSPVRIKKVVKGPEKKALYQLQVNNKKLEVTEDHPFLTPRGWVQAKDLKETDRLLGEKQGKEIKSIRKLDYLGPQEVWNFEVDSEDPMAHVVVANGLPTGDLVTQVRIKKTNAKTLP